jgi:hypothetical protein
LGSKKITISPILPDIDSHHKTINWQAGLQIFKRAQEGNQRTKSRDGADGKLEKWRRGLKKVKIEGFEI